MEADADLSGGYAKIGVASGKILDSVIPTTIARTSDIAAQIATVVNGAPASFDTLKEIADYIATDQTAASSLTTLVGTKLSSETAASTYAPLASPIFTGTVSGITKSMVGLANVDNTSDSSKPVSAATQTALDAKLSTTTATSTYATISNLALKAPLASPAFTGTVDFSGATVTGLTTTIADSSITSAKILDGAIMNIDINASAAIDKTKIAGTAVTLADTASVTNAMLANSFVGINGNAVYLGQVITIPVGAKTFYNNTGTLPTTGMVAGDIYIQY
mgnify:CR=1 FL=1